MTMTDLRRILNDQQLGHLDDLIPAVESYIERHGKPEVPIVADQAWAYSREARNVIDIAQAVDRNDQVAVAKAIERLSSVVRRWNGHLVAVEAGFVRSTQQ
jgi:hypothetical protein